MSGAPVDWAILPAAGRGTRLYPAAAVVPKVLLPVGIRPMLQWAMQEAIAAGIPGLVLVVGPEQTALRDFVEVALREGRRRPDSPLGRLGAELAGVELRWVEQPSPRGIGDAFVRCRDVTLGSPFAVLLPDNWFHAEPPAIAQVVETFRTTGMETLGLTRVDPAEAELFGNVGRVRLEQLGGPSHRILELQDKGEGTYVPAGAEPGLRGCARYVCTQRFYDALTATGPPPAGEWDDVPAFQHLVEGGVLAGHEIGGRHFDVGHPAGYLAAAHWLHERGGDRGA